MPPTLAATLESPWLQASWPESRNAYLASQTRHVFGGKTSPSGHRELSGILVAHVDDLLLSGDDEAKVSFDKVGHELGYGSVECEDFVRCGKRIRRAEDGTIRLSMVEYRRNLREAELPASRRRDPIADAALSDYERRQLRAVLGSLQWLVAQPRFDMAFTVSSLQSAEPSARMLLFVSSGKTATSS